MPHAPQEVLEIVDGPSGLHAFLVIDDTTLGPAAGGIRTRAYEHPDLARLDAVRLARAMTLKCALAGLAAGGGKCVVLDHPGLDRARAFAVLGDHVEALEGRFRTAGDLGTTEPDLEIMARRTRYVHAGGERLAHAGARGLLRCAEACAEAARWDGLARRRVLVQGAGVIGAAVAQALAGSGARVVVADLDRGRAAALAARLGAEVVAADAALRTPCDLISPCAIGGVVTREVATRLPARLLCGAANNVFAPDGAAEAMQARGILWVPDIIASAGAVIEGIGRTVMGLADRTPLIDALGATAREVLALSVAGGPHFEEVAVGLAERRLAAGREARAATPSPR